MHLSSRPTESCFVLVPTSNSLWNGTAVWGSISKSHVNMCLSCPKSNRMREVQYSSAHNRALVLFYPDDPVVEHSAMPIIFKPVGDATL